MESMKNTRVARTAEKMRPVRDWRSYALPNGQVVRRGRYYFAWSRGYFVGAYDTLDDALESLAFRNEVFENQMNDERGTVRANDAN